MCGIEELAIFIHQRVVEKERKEEKKPETQAFSVWLY